MNKKAISIGAAGGGGGGCYEDFRTQFKPDLNLVIEECNVKIFLKDDLERAIYNYEYILKVNGDRSENDWFFIIPFSKGKVTNIWAEDNLGGLEYKIDSESNEKTRLSIKFREPILTNQKYIFNFGYETDIISIKSEGFFSKIVTYNDWFSHNNPCNILNINVNLPKKYSILKTVPPTDIEHNPIKFDVNNLRPLEYYSFLLAYRVKSISLKFWIWIIGIFLSAFLGNLIGNLF